MNHPPINKLTKTGKDKWNFKNGQWIRTMIYNIKVKELITLGEATMEKEPQWFKNFLKVYKSDQIKNDKRWDENNKRWDENNKRWDENNKRWDEQLLFNKNHKH